MSKILKRKYDDDFESGRGKQDEWEVTGVSRSGRVRKKSSKLLDFESPDDIDNRHRRRGGDSLTSPNSSSGSGRGRGRGSAASASASHTERSNTTVAIQQREPLPNDTGDDIYSSSDEFPADVPAEESSPSSSSSDDEAVSDEERLVDDHGPITGPEESNNRANEDAPSNVNTSSRGGQSLYMLEKSSKKKLVVRDGRVIGRTKAQRKDKGKTRFTAYMLWAKEVRKEILRANPETDFATISKRLGELWATVPNSEKYAWKRRAKRVAMTKPTPDTTAQSAVIQGQGGPNQQAEGNRWRGSGSRSKFINKVGSGSSTIGGSSARQDSGSLSGGVPMSSAVINASRSTAGLSATSGTARHQQQQGAEFKAGLSPGSSGGRGLVAEAAVGPGLYKVVGTQPVDVAAHLKLLGESLGIIGERLKEHEGQIAVSGSLSVLLDSLLCALGPLICLTRQLPETNSCPPEMLSKLLDNIAYFMPGL